MSIGTPLLPLVGPVHPDFFVCNPLYGTGLLSRDCVLAASDLRLEGHEDVVYYTRTSAPPNLPFTVMFGGCYITVDVAGPTQPEVVQIAPSRIRQMAAWVISQCVVGRRGTGGYTTWLILNMLAFSPSRYHTLAATTGYLPSNPNGDIDFVQFSPLTAFVTVMVSGPEETSRRPGDTDPMIPIKIGESISFLTIMSPDGYDSSVHTDGRRYIELGISRLGVEGGSLVPWWQRRTSPTVDEMTYQCDASLGSPPEVDCSQIEWNQPSPPSDTLSVGPGNPTFLHSNTCYLAISATINTILTWAQIRTAVSSLLSICVESPVQAAAQGGRAYWHPSAKIDQPRRKRRDGLSGLNALPPHANITVFQQREPYLNPVAELGSCTWKAVSEGAPVSNCGSP